MAWLAIYKVLIPSLKLLDLSDNNITHKGMESVVTIIKSSTTHLSVACNPIGDAGTGVQVFSLLMFKHLIQLRYKYELH